MALGEQHESYAQGSDNGPLSRPPDGGARALGDGRNRCFNPGAPCLLRPGFRSLPWLPLVGATDLPHTPCAMSNPGDTAVAEVPSFAGPPERCHSAAPVLCGSP